MQTNDLEFRLPPTLHIEDIDDDDAFDDNVDDLPSARNPFSPDVIREELARQKPILEESWEEHEDPVIPPTNTLDRDDNTSVSTLDIGPGAGDADRRPPPLPLDTPLDTSLSSNFSSISLSPAIGNEQTHASHIDRPWEYPMTSPEPNSADAVQDRLHSASTHSSAFTSPPTSASTFNPRDDAPFVANAPMSGGLNPSGSARSPSEDSRNHQLTPPASAELSPSTAPTSITTSSPSSPATSPSTNSSSLPPIQPQSGPPLPGKKFVYKPQKTTGPSMFEKVRSKTRPTFLPPKPKEEDNKHLADWQQMMKQSRATAEKRRKALQERRAAREKEIEDSLPIWEREIMPDWKIVHRNPEMRKLWWKGIPTKLRGQLWEKAVGNALALSKDHYRTCLARAKRALTSGVFPKQTLEMMEEDIDATLPTLHIFNRQNGPLYSDLKDMLCAWVVSRSDEGLGYTVGGARIAAMLLLNLAPPQAFVVMRNLLERHCMASFFGGEQTKDDVEAYYRIFDTMLADGMPKIYFNFKQHQIAPREYLPDWVIPGFLDHLPFEACARVWDVLLLEGDSFLHRTALGILAVLEPRLFFPERKELLELLRGENKAAIEVAKREGQALDGGKYEIYGVDEETLWERIDAMRDWWKETTWTRLIQRELPDI